jgi:hypothetical protein
MLLGAIDAEFRKEHAATGQHLECLRDRLVEGVAAGQLWLPTTQAIELSRLTVELDQLHRIFYGVHRDVLRWHLDATVAAMRAKGADLYEPWIKDACVVLAAINAEPNVEPYATNTR